MKKYVENPNHTTGMYMGATSVSLLTNLRSGSKDVGRATTAHYAAHDRLKAGQFLNLLHDISEKV